MPEIEVIAAVRDFVELGGNVLLAIAFVTGLMWSLIVERVFYFRMTHPQEKKRVQALWSARPDHSSWQAHQIRRMLVSDVKLKLERGLGLIKTAVALCPLFGLLGTVTGMIEVFDVMALAGSGNARSMAAGVSRATIPTMAGMVGALSGVFAATMLARLVDRETEHLSEELTMDH